MEAPAETKDSIFGRFPVNRDMTCRVAASEQPLIVKSKNTDAGPCLFHTSFPSYADEASLAHAKPLQRRAGKTQKSSSFCPKRPRPEHVQASMGPTNLADANSPNKKYNSAATQCFSAERYTGVGQKHCLDGKKGDKKHFRHTTKTKLDTFFPKAGLSSTSSAGAGNILGMYGLKSDIHDVTKHVDELSLNDLLDGSYEYPSLRQDKGKKVIGTNETLVNTLKKACSILQPQNPIKQQNVAELDCNCGKKTDTGILCSGSSVACGTDTTKGDKVMESLVSASKVTTTEPFISALCQPEDVLKRLVLPPAKDLDVLLLDIPKASSSRITNDIRFFKPMTSGGLQPFPWSHFSSGSLKATTDTGKSSNSRSKWVKVGSIVNSLGDASNLIDLNSVNFDPESSKKVSDAIGLPNSSGCSSSFDWQLKPCFPAESSLRVPKVEAEHSPRLVVAAETLCEIARNPISEKLTNEILRWFKKPDQKAMKPPMPRSTEKTEVVPSIPKIVSKRSDPVEIIDRMIHPKKPRHSIDHKKMDGNHTNHIRKEPSKWSIPKLGRSPPSRKHGEGSGSVKVKMIPPPYKRGLDKGFDSDLRKAVSMDWGRGKSKNE